MVERYGLQGQRLDEVAAGAVMKHSSQWNLTRESVLGSGLAAETPGLDLQRACGTGLEAAILLANKIALGQIDCAIAAGVDTVSDPPVVYPKSFQQLLLRSYRGKTMGERVEAVVRFAAEESAARSTGNRGAPHRLVYGGKHGTHGEDMGNQRVPNRTSSRWRAIRRQRCVRFRGSTGIWCAIISESRKTTTSAATPVLTSWAKLKPVFDTSGAGTLTAGNSTPMTDGASAVLLASRSLGTRAQLAGAGVFELRQSRRR